MKCSTYDNEIHKFTRFSDSPTHYGEIRKIRLDAEDQIFARTYTSYVGRLFVSIP